MFRFPHARMLIAAAMLGAFVPAASQTLPGGPLPPQPAPRPGSEAEPTPGFSGTTPESFAAWRARFRARALAVGISSATLDAAFAGVAPNARVLERDNRQPEFTRPIWEYLDSAVSDDRIATGRGEATAKAAILERIEARYGVDGETVLAIWGIESAYGDNFGSIPVIESMATLAHEPTMRSVAMSPA